MPPMRPPVRKVPGDPGKAPAALSEVPEQGGEAAGRRRGHHLQGVRFLRDGLSEPRVSEGGQGGSGTTIAKGSFKTKNEATIGISKMLSEQGIAKTDPKFAAKFDELYKEVVTDDMPIQ